MNYQQLAENIRKKQSFLCVGLDTDPLKLPEPLQGKGAGGVLAFNKAIVDATAPYAVAYKPNTAFYEAQGPAGWQALAETVTYIRLNYPNILVIADAKRGDIGNTSSLYARAFFDTMDVDALTVAPYMGSDSVKPFMQYDDKWVVLLALTSNPGSHDFQYMQDRQGTRLFEEVLQKAQTWTDKPLDKLMFVVGATQREMFIDVRKAAPRSFLLVPGVGAQGGSLDDVVRYGMLNDGNCGLLVNASRSIIYASSGDDYAQAAAAEAQKLQQEMAAALNK